MTEAQKSAELTRKPAALLDVVTSVPGVRAIEPGMGTSLRTLDARVRRSQSRTAHFGLQIDTDEGSALVEVSLDRTRPVRETVLDIQRALQRVLTDKSDIAVSEVTVRVQSLHM